MMACYFVLVYTYPLWIISPLRRFDKILSKWGGEENENMETCVGNSVDCTVRFDWIPVLRSRYLKYPAGKRRGRRLCRRHRDYYAACRRYCVHRYTQGRKRRKYRHFSALRHWCTLRVRTSRKLYWSVYLVCMVPCLCCTCCCFYGKKQEECLNTYP